MASEHNANVDVDARYPALHVTTICAPWSLLVSGTHDYVFFFFDLGCVCVCACLSGSHDYIAVISRVCCSDLKSMLQ